MKIKKTVYNHNLRKPDSYTVECGQHKRFFNAGEEKKVGEWVKGLWRQGEDSPAYVYYNIDWDCDHVLYCKYEFEIDDLYEFMEWRNSDEA